MYFASGSLTITLVVIILRLIETPLVLAFTILFWKPVELSIMVSAGVFYKELILRFAGQLAVLSLSSRMFLFLFSFKFSKDCTVIVPTVGEMDEEFLETVKSILENNPYELVISTVGAEKLERAAQICAALDDPRLRCMAIDHPNKRKQVVAAVNTVQTAITISADDHVFWPETFLQSALAPFEDAHVGLVGTVKRVRRQRQKGIKADVLNFIACIYLERHNFECTASHNIDGGVFVISGRTALYRTSVVQTHAFQQAFMNETWFWGAVGPLNADDDNFITRWMVNSGYRTVFHYAEDALVQTTLGTGGNWKKFQGQLNRWARTTWRSNSTTLFADRTVWLTQPWSVYAVYFSAFVNLALFYDTALVMLLYRSSFSSAHAMSWLCFLLFLSKVIKPLPHYMRHPADLAYLPLQILFGYYHSLVKLYALFTCMNVAWGTREGVDKQNTRA